MEFSIEARTGYLYVWQSGLLTEVGVLPLQKAVEAAMKLHGLRRVLFDNRETDRPSDNVLKVMRAWSERTSFDAVALVLRSSLLGVETSMAAVSKGLRRRGFSDVGEAERWLVGLPVRQKR